MECLLFLLFRISLWGFSITIILFGAGLEQVNAFQEGWENAPLGFHAPSPSTDTNLPTRILSDAGVWFLNDTVTAFPECGPTPHQAEIFSSGSNKALRLVAKNSGSSCADNVWVNFLQFPEFGNTTAIPLTNNTVISFQETGTLVTPQPGSPRCLVPPCGDVVSIRIDDNIGNALVYILQRAPTRGLFGLDPARCPNSIQCYKEVLLDPTAGTFSRNLFADFRTIPRFNPNGAMVKSIVFEVGDVGSATLDNFIIGSSAGPGPGLPPTLLIAKTGSGSGTVTSSPEGINCGTDCRESFAIGTRITLRPIPNAGSVFTGWSGGGCNGRGPCTLTVNSNVMVTATFTVVSSVIPLSDFNNDGNVDLLWRHHSTGTVFGWLMNGLSISTAGSLGTVNQGWHLQGHGDLNGDGNADVVWRHATTGAVLVWLMNGLSIQSANTIGTVNPVWDFQRLGDLNGDGNDDLVWRHSTTGTALAWLMNGLSIQSANTIGTVNPVWQLVGMGDLNGDGNEDFTWRHSTTGTALAWLMNGVTIQMAGSLGTVNQVWQLQGMGDLNGDGNGDVVWRHATNGAVLVWLMNGLTIQSANTIGTVNTVRQLQGIGDLNGDGNADLIWRHSTAGTALAWLMNGASIQSAGSLGTINPVWQLQ